MLLFFLLTLLNFNKIDSKNNEIGMTQEIKPGIYEHYSGKKYEVIGTARYSENPNQEFVIYKQLYESAIRGTNTKLPIGTLWARPIEMFLELVEYNGQKISRFKKIN